MRRYSKYNELMDKSESCIAMANLFEDEKIKKFYGNAAAGYEIKAKRLLMAEVTTNEDWQQEQKSELAMLYDNKDLCLMKAEEYSKIDEVNLAEFYFNAAKGYTIKIRNYLNQAEKA